MNNAIDNNTADDIQFAFEVRHGFDHGNYANAYDTEDCADMLDAIDPKASKDYRNAAIVGFFASYELNEIPGAARGTHDEAYWSKAGQACVMAGYLDSRDGAYAADGLTQIVR